VSPSRPDFAGVCDRLHARGGVHRIAGHAFASRSACHRDFTCHDPCPCGQSGGTHLVTELCHHRQDFERRADSTLCVAFCRDRRSPYRHHRVADELLDDTAVAEDDRPRPLEIFREELPHLFGIARLRQRREADEVGEEQRADSPLRDGKR
jgi:hypothetical protein